jgi:hypothetical protein
MTNAEKVALVTGATGCQGGRGCSSHSSERLLDRK